MVANAHQLPDPDEMKTFDRGYLLGVSLFVILLNLLPLLQFSVHGIPEIEDCSRQEGDHQTFPTLMVTAAVFGFLFFIVIVLTSMRTRRNLEKIDNQHLKNLPAKNALTFLGKDSFKKPSYCCKLGLYLYTLYKHRYKYCSFSLRWSLQSLVN